MRRKPARYSEKSSEESLYDLSNLVPPWLYVFVDIVFCPMRQTDFVEQALLLREDFVELAGVVSLICLGDRIPRNEEIIVRIGARKVGNKILHPIFHLGDLLANLGQDQDQSAPR